MSDPGAPPLLVTEAAPGVRLLTLNRPAKRNAIDQALHDALIDVFRALDADADVRAAVVTGAGSAFCAGVDLKDAASPAVLEERRRTGVSPPSVLLSVRTPVIAAVNGPCVAGGLEVALACDFVLASEQAAFADTHVQLGLLPSWGAAALLPLAVGLRRAKELALTGRFMGADEALACGLVAAVVPPDALVATAVERAERIAAAPPQQVAGLLRIYDENAELAALMAHERKVLLASRMDVSGAAARGDELASRRRGSP